MAEWTPPGAVEVPADTVQATPAAPAVPKQPRFRPSRHISLLERGINLLPAAGNIAGEMGGGALAALAIPETAGASALAIPAATISGGGAGQAAGRGAQLAALNFLHLPPPEDMNNAGIVPDIAGQAGWGALTSAGGQLLPWLARSVGHGLMGAALRTAEKPAVETAIAERIRPGKSVITGATGAEQVAERTGQYGAQMDDVLANAASQGVHFSISDATAGAKQAIVDAAKVSPQRAKAMQKVLDDFLSAYKPVRNSAGRVVKMPGASIDPAAFQEIKQGAEAIASPIYKAQGRGNYVPGLMNSARAEVYKAIADDARAALSARVPDLGETGYAALNAKMSPLIGDLAPVMNRAEKTLGGPVLSMGGHGVGFQPFNLLPQGVAGQAALTATDPFVQLGLRFGPRAVQQMFAPQLLQSVVNRVNPQEAQ